MRPGLAIAWISLLAVVAAAHPDHSSVAEAKLNPKTNRLEVAMRVWPEDLERVLSARTQTNVRLDMDAKRIDPLIDAYLTEAFLLAPEGARPGPDWRPPPPGDPPIDRIRWVGKELRDHEVWLYFEAELPAGATSVEGVWFSYRLLWEVAPDQENLLRVRDRGRRVTLRSTRADAWIEIKLEPTDEAKP
ncbi:MAG: DUF6702 family protein [Planctomycetota bacterium]